MVKGQLINTLGPNGYQRKLGSESCNRLCDWKKLRTSMTISQKISALQKTSKLKCTEKRMWEYQNLNRCWNIKCWRFEIYLIFLQQIAYDVKNVHLLLWSDNSWTFYLNYSLSNLSVTMLHVSTFKFGNLTSEILLNCGPLTKKCLW